MERDCKSHQRVATGRGSHGRRKTLPGKKERNEENETPSSGNDRQPTKLRTQKLNDAKTSRTKSQIYHKTKGNNREAAMETNPTNKVSF